MPSEGRGQPRLTSAATGGTAGAGAGAERRKSARGTEPRPEASHAPTMRCRPMKRTTNAANEAGKDGRPRRREEELRPRREHAPLGPPAAAMVVAAAVARRADEKEERREDPAGGGLKPPAVLVRGPRAPATRRLRPPGHDGVTASTTMTMAAAASTSTQKIWTEPARPATATASTGRHHRVQIATTLTGRCRHDGKRREKRKERREEMVPTAWRARENKGSTEKSVLYTPRKVAVRKKETREREE